jgi:hypothetical protein
MQSSRHRQWVSLPIAVAVLFVACGSPPTGQSTSEGTASASRLSLPTKDNELSAVACPTPTDCIAVGYVAEGANTVGPDTRTLIEENKGRGCKVVPSPNAANEAGSELSGVTCLRSGSCIAVGQSNSSASNPKTLVEQNVGSGWTIVPSPNSSACEGIGSLSKIACAGATRCVAVGDYESENGIFQTLIEEDTGAGWTVVPSPNSSPTVDNLLTGVACAGPVLCVAVGYSGLGASVPLIEQNAGSGWTIVTTLGAGSLSGVACPSPELCVATGGNFSISNTTITEEPLIEEMTNGNWARVAIPKQVGTLAQVACPTETYCISVGDLYSFGVSAGNPLIMAERRTSGWTIGMTTDIGSQNDTLGGVACVDTDRCIAVGNHLVENPYPGVRVTFIAQHTSQGWTVLTSPNV